MKFSIKDFSSKCGEILNEKLHFLCSDSKSLEISKQKKIVPLSLKLPACSPKLFSSTKTDAKWVFCECFETARNLPEKGL